MIIDSSAILAIIGKEPGYERIVHQLRIPDVEEPLRRGAAVVARRKTTSDVAGEHSGHLRSDRERIDPSWSITLTDFSPGMIEAARRELGEHAGYVVADAQELVQFTGRLRAGE